MVVKRKNYCAFVSSAHRTRQASGRINNNKLRNTPKCV